MTGAQDPGLLFAPETMTELRRRFRIVELPDDAPGGQFDAELPSAFAIIGQPDLPAERLLRAGELHALLNIEGNFFPNVD